MDPTAMTTATSDGDGKDDEGMRIGRPFRPVCLRRFGGSAGAMLMMTMRQQRVSGEQRTDIAWR